MAFVTACLLLAAVLLTGCQRNDVAPVVVYTSQDQVYSEEILKQFEAETGVPVRAVYDSEAVKTVGLANRLLLERSNPRCDVWWSNEELRTRQLEQEGVFREQDPWQAFGYRSRQLVVNTNLLKVAEVPNSLLALTNVTFKGKVALAYPMFGTTATHFMALRETWGREGWQAWCQALVANEALVVDGNSVVVKLVGRGEAAIGMTDSDDIRAGQREGLPIAAVDFEETLMIPNTVAFVRGSRRPQGAQKLVDYLSGPVVGERLVAVNALQGAKAPERGLKPDWVTLIKELEPATEDLKKLFLR